MGLKIAGWSIQEHLDNTLGMSAYQFNIIMDRIAEGDDHSITKEIFFNAGKAGHASIDLS